MKVFPVLQNYMHVHKIFKRESIKVVVTPKLGQQSKKF